MKRAEKELFYDLCRVLDHGAMRVNHLPILDEDDRNWWLGVFSHSRNWLNDSIDRYLRSL